MTLEDVEQKREAVIEQLMRLNTAESLNYAFILLENLALNRVRSFIDEAVSKEREACIEIIERGDTHPTVMVREIRARDSKA